MKHCIKQKIILSNVKNILILIPILCFKRMLINNKFQNYCVRKATKTTNTLQQIRRNFSFFKYLTCSMFSSTNVGNFYLIKYFQRISVRCLLTVFKPTKLFQLSSLPRKGRLQKMRFYELMIKIQIREETPTKTVKNMNF